MADVLHFLEFLGSILSHELEAVRVILQILLIDQAVNSACNASTLEWWQDENLRNFGSISIIAQMSFVNGEKSHQILCRFLVYHKVVPKRTWLNNHSSFDEKGKQSLCVVVLLMEGLIRKANTLHNLVLIVEALVLCSW